MAENFSRKMENTIMKLNQKINIYQNFKKVWKDLLSKF